MPLRTPLFSAACVMVASFAASAKRVPCSPIGAHFGLVGSLYLGDKMAGSMFDLSGKVAMVTGGNGGIGLGIARGLAITGANIVVAARNEPKTSRAVDELGALGVQALGLATDVADEDSVAEAVSRTVEQFGRVDILVNNAGISIRREPQEYSIEEWDRVLNVNLRSMFLCSKAVHPHMAANGGGSIINIGSMTVFFGSDWSSSYAASKGGAAQFTRSLAVAWAKYGIRVNCILPGWIYTELTEPIEGLYPERHALINQRIPAGRWGTPDDMAGAAVFLASPSADYVTGTIMPVDGGYSSF